MKKSLLKTLLLSAAALLLVACSKQTPSDNSASSNSSSSQTASSSTSQSSSETAASSKTKTLSAADGSTFIHKLGDGTELSYTYKLAIPQGNYRNDEAKLLVFNTSTFSFQREDVASILTSDNGVLTFDLETSGSTESLTIYDNGTYAVRTDKMAYTTFDDGTFTFELKETGETATGQDIKRLYDLLKKHNLPTVDDYLKAYDEQIRYINDTFAQ